MLDIVKDGTLIIAEGISLPESCNLTSEPFSKGWRAVRNFESFGLGKHLSRLGWTFLYKAAPVKVSVLGIGNNRTLRKAFRKIIRGSRPVKFNCLEITEAIRRRFIGITYVRMSAHARDIKEHT
jgi:hypothetical protein